MNPTPIAVPLPCSNWLPSVPFLHFGYQAKCKARVTAELHAKLLVSGREGFEGRHCLFSDFFSRFSVPFPVCLHFLSVSQQILVSLSFFLFFFFLLTPQLITSYFYSPLVFTITLLFQVNLICVFGAFSLHLSSFLTLSFLCILSTLSLLGLP